MRTARTKGFCSVWISTPRRFARIGGPDFGVGETSPRGIASHGSPAELYMLGDDNDALYTLDTATGAAARVGAVDEFGVGESFPFGLTSHADGLYMTGRGHDALYELDTATSAAARVGAVDEFGVGEESPAGIATGYRLPEGFTINGTTGEITYTGAAAVPGVHTLYARVSDDGNPDDTAVDDTVSVIVTVPDRPPVFDQNSYTFDIAPGVDGTDTARPVGAVTAVDPDGDPVSYGLCSLSASGSAEPMYMVGSDSNALYTVDTATGALARVGSADGFDAGITLVSGLGWHDGELYLVGGPSAELDGIYEVDTTTGAATRVARMVDSQVGYRPLTAIASHRGVMYATSSHNETGRLFRIDLQAGIASQVGVDDFGGVGERQPEGLASHQGKLYMVGALTNRLYEIDPATGAATAVGSAVAFDAPEGGGGGTPSGLASHGADLYMTSYRTRTLYRLDTTTGTVASVGTLTGPGITEDSPQGIASKTDVFAIDPSTGAITYTGHPAADGIEYTLEAQAGDGRASDGGGTSHAVDTTTPVTMTVGNQAPEFNERGYSYTLTSGSDGRVDTVTVGTPTAADPEGQALTYSLRASDPPERMYMAGSRANALYTLDSHTGAAARVGAVGQFGASVTWPRGLAWHNGQLYMVDVEDNSLHTLDIITGEATRVTSANLSSQFKGIASHNGELYLTTSAVLGINIYGGRLYHVDLDTSTFTQIGDTDFGVGESIAEGIASHGNPAELYMTGHQNKVLYTLDTTTGAATRIGTADRFGVAEPDPFGLTSHDDHLYMTGRGHDALYELDTTTGAATRIGSAKHFDVGEDIPFGIASGYRRPEGFTIDGATGEIGYTGGPAPPGVHTLYVQVSDHENSTDATDTVVDDTVRVTVTIPDRPPAFAENPYTFTITPGTDGTDTARPVGAVPAVDPEDDPVSYNLRSLGASGSSEPVYMAGDGSDALYTVNTATGAIARVGSAYHFGAGVTEVRGLGWHDGELYLVGGHSSEQDGIYTVDTSTGMATRVARLADYGVGYRPMSAIASHRGILYATSSHNGTGRLFRIDLQAGTAAQIGDNSFGSVDENAPTGLASHQDKLYMVGASTAGLYEIDPATGTATAVGSATAFDAPDGGENSPSGLASHGTVLYMTGNQANSLYTLDTTTGTATPVGTLTGPGVTENTPQGITSKTDVFAINPSTGALTYTGHPAVEGIEYTLEAQAGDNRASDGGGTSHAIDSTTPVKVTVAFNRAPVFNEHSYSYTLTPAGDDNADPDPVAVGTPTAADPDGHALTYSLRASDPAERMYMIGNDTDALYTLDSGTGAATTRVGTATEFGVDETSPRSLAWHNGQLYMIGNDTGSLYTLDVITGEATRVGGSGVAGGSGMAGGNGVSGSSGMAGGSGVPVGLSGLASHNGELYATTSTLRGDGSRDGRLYRVDIDTSMFTRIGGIDFGVDEGHPEGIASHGSPAELYMTGSADNALYTLNTATGAAARVGTVDDFGVAESHPTGLTFHADGLYMTGRTANALYELDTPTGTATRVGTVEEFGVGEGAPSGIASGYHRPEGFIIDSTTGEISYTGGPTPPGVHTLYVQVSDHKNSAHAADTAVDDTARITVTVPDQTPVFAQNSYTFTIPAGTDGTDTARPVGTVTAIDPEGDPVSYSLRSLSASGSSEPVYMIGDGSDALHTVDIATGAIARVGTVTGFGAGITEGRGLGWHDGKLYLVGGHSSEQDGIYEVDTTTGIATRVARLIDYGVGYQPLTAIASHRGILYATSSHNGTGRLFRINLQADTATQIGRQRLR